MGERSILELLLRTKKSGDAVKEVSGDLKKLKQASGEAAAAAEKLNLGMLAVKGSILTAGIALLRQVGPLIELGSQANRAETALIGLAGGSEEAALAMEAVERGAGGAIDKLSAATNASRLFAMGLAEDAEQAEKLTQISVTLGAAMGKGPQQAFEEFTLLLANQSILRLDTFGIGAGKVRTRMAELAAEMPNATRETRFLQATMEQAEVSMGKLESVGFEATTSVDQLKAEVMNAKIVVGQFLADGLIPWIDGIRAVIDANKEHNHWLNETSAGIEFQIARLREVKEANGEYRNSITDAKIAELEAKNARIEHAAAMQAEIDRLNGLAGMYAAATTAAEENAEANRGIALSLGELTQAKLAAEAMDALNQQWKEGDITAEEYKSAFAEVSTQIAGMDGEAAAAQIKMFDLNQEFAKTGNLETYVDGVKELGQDIGALPDSKTVFIDVVVRGDIPQFQHGGSFTVGGPPGVDQSPVFFMASRGERVEVKPNAANLGQGANEGGGGMRGDGPLIGTYNSYGGMDDRLFLEKFKSIARRA
jgi:hypothetical protein